MSLAELAAFARRHGILGTVGYYALQVPRAGIDFDVVRVETAGGEPTRTAEGEGYVTRRVDREEYETGTAALGRDHERGWAFDRGDACFANFFGGELVGYSFYARTDTRVRPGLVIRLPEDVTYLYAGFTHPDHRGRGLSEARANARRRHDGPGGIERRVVWFSSVDNLASRRASEKMGASLVGHLAYVKVWGRYRCFASPGCRAAGIAFANVDEVIDRQG